MIIYLQFYLFNLFKVLYSKFKTGNIFYVYIYDCFLNFPLIIFLAFYNHTFSFLVLFQILFFVIYIYIFQFCLYFIYLSHFLSSFYFFCQYSLIFVANTFHVTLSLYFLKCFNKV